MLTIADNGIVFFGSVVAGTLIASKILRKALAPQICDMRCYCGKVAAKVTVVTKNVPSAECHCKDCVDFAVWMREGGSKIDVLSHNGGCCMVQLFKDELNITEGAKLICRAKMKEGTHVHRLFTKCCKTPIGLTATLSCYPMIVLYRDNFYGPDIFGPTWWRLHFQDGEKKIKDFAICSTGLSSSFLAFLIGRLLFGLIACRGQPDIMKTICEDDAIIVKTDN